MSWGRDGGANGAAKTEVSDGVVAANTLTTDGAFSVAIVDGSPEPCPPRLVREMCEGADYVIAADRGAVWCRLAGVAPDAFVGDGDSAGDDVLAWVRERVPERTVLPREKDVTDLEAAFLVGETAAAERGRIPAFMVTCALGGRLDHALAVMGVLRRHAEWPITVRGDGVSAFVLSEHGCTRVLSKGFATALEAAPAANVAESIPGDAPLGVSDAPSSVSAAHDCESCDSMVDPLCVRALAFVVDFSAGETLSLIPLADGTVVSERGLHWPLDHRRLDALDDLGVSNEVEAPDAVEVVCHRGTCLVVLPRV